MKCLNCGCVEGKLLKEFDNEKNYSWYELSEMTEVCVSCGSENIKIEKGE
jgi:Zn finger protein HypA/HybF involved in hydrogenase expression|tara:strand:+ start:1455 stop:1604 length:150 start_codon:yes stop_codon:yes gene_type:complete